MRFGATEPSVAAPLCAGHGKRRAKPLLFRRNRRYSAGLALSHGSCPWFDPRRAHQLPQCDSAIAGQRLLVQSNQREPARLDVGRIEPGLTTTTHERRGMAAYDLYTIARFWAKVRVRRPSQCWPWRGGASDGGYGRFRVNGRLVLAHHVAWELAHGPLPEKPGYHGSVVRHSCDTPACCNWRHLRHGTQLDNVEDMDVKGRRVMPSPQKLTAEQALAIIADPRPHRVIAPDYGISHTHVGAIKRGERLGQYTAPDRKAADKTATEAPALRQQQGTLL